MFQVYCCQFFPANSPRLCKLFDLIERWKIILAVLMDADWVAAIQKELSYQTPLRYSANEWVLRHRQYYLAHVLRKLLNLEF